MRGEVKPIRSEADYAAALKEVERLWDAAIGTPECDRLDVLATLIDAYEAEQYPIDPPDPIDAIKFRMEQQGLTRKDLEPLIGTRTRVAEVLNRRRNLSISMIRRLHETWGISADVLIGRSVPRTGTTLSSDAQARPNLSTEVETDALRFREPRSTRKTWGSTMPDSGRVGFTASVEQSVHHHLADLGWTVEYTKSTTTPFDVIARRGTRSWYIHISASSTDWLAWPSGTGLSDLKSVAKRNKATPVVARVTYRDGVTLRYFSAQSKRALDPR